MRSFRYFLVLASLCALAPGVYAAASVKVSPVAVAFTHQVGNTAIPAPQTLAVSAASGSAAVMVYTNSGSSQWLSYSPQLGKTALSIKVSVNPTTLPIGQYTENIVLITPDTGGDSVVVPITLTVKAPPSDVKVSPTIASFTYRLGEAPPSPATIFASTTGGLLSYSVAAPSAKWLRVSPTGGAIFPGFRTAITASVDTAELAPGTQKGTFTISTPDAITKTVTVTVNLSVQPGTPVASSIWPSRLIQGAPDSVITIIGDRFFSGTTVKSGNVSLKPAILGTTSLNVVVPAGLLSNTGTVPLVVTNPDPGGGTSQAIAIEIIPPGPMLVAVVNSASQQPTNFAPGTILTLYGSGLGMDTITAFDGSTFYLPTSLGGTRVYLNNQPLPLVYASARQVSVAAPNTMETERPFMFEVEFNGAKSPVFPVVSSPSSPGIFTTSGTGTGNAAAFQVDPVKGDISLNSDKTPAAKGSVLVFYVTGIPPPQPMPPDGFVAIEPSVASISGVAVFLGDTPAEVLYAGFAPGLSTGILQINAKIPDTSPTGKAVPLLVKFNNATSQNGVTLNIK